MTELEERQAKRIVEQEKLIGHLYEQLGFLGKRHTELGYVVTNLRAELAEARRNRSELGDLILEEPVPYAGEEEDRLVIDETQADWPCAVCGRLLHTECRDTCDPRDYETASGKGGR